MKIQSYQIKKMANNLIQFWGGVRAIAEPYWYPPELWGSAFSAYV
ncbi:MAG: hypothetical protein RMX96_12165 [Nostoc sp. ChiSLP02]|nr:hypothetical protein [Nostoc sp. DedSLP05]MDZ8103425.1 hypothetical protein [Nostoc sp. DedSLP01]MDZ8185596.1 hypothetical protein [Nostoc sp. ChiSLP02]